MSALSITPTTPIPDLLRAEPRYRKVLDRYGLRGCGGPNGPAESLGFFARAHDVPIGQLLAELELAAKPGGDGTTREDEPRPVDQIYRRFFLSGIAVVLTLGAVWGAWLLARIAWTGSFRAAGLHEINAHGHAQIFGWIGLFVMGFAYQAFPRFKHTDLRWPGAAFLSWWLMLGGLIARAILEPLAATQPIWVGAALIAAWIEVIAIGIFIAVLAGTFSRASKPIVYYDYYIFSALAWFFIQAVGEAVYLAATLQAIGDAKLDLVATWQAPLRDFQIHGFALLMALGVSQRLLHHVFGLPEANRTLSLVALPILNLAVLGEAVGMVLMRKLGHGWAGLWYGSLLVLTVTVVALALQWRVFARAPEPDRSLKFIRTAYGWLVVSLALLVFLPAYQYGVLAKFATDSAAAMTGFSHAYYGASRHAITVGFLSLMIVGVSSKVVPTLNGMEGATLPRLWLPYLLINLGCTTRVVGQIATDFSPAAFWVAGPSGVLEVAGLALWGQHVARIILGYYRPQSTVRGKPLVAGEPIEGGHVVGEVLDAHPELLPVFLEFGFRPLASATLRRRLAGAVTIGRACRLLGVDEPAFVEVLNTRARSSRKSLFTVDAASARVGCSCCEERKPS